MSHADQRFPHTHIVEKTYTTCKCAPKHQVEEHVFGCTCGKEAIGSFREFGLGEGECLKCVEENKEFEDF